MSVLVIVDKRARAFIAELVHRLSIENRIVDGVVDDLFFVGHVLERELGGDHLSARPINIHVDGFFVPILRYDAYRLDLIAMSRLDIFDRIEHGLLRSRDARSKIGLPDIAVMRDVLGEQASLPRATQLIVVLSDDRDDRENNHSSQDFD